MLSLNSVFYKEDYRVDYIIVFDVNDSLLFIIDCKYIYCFFF